VQNLAVPSMVRRILSLMRHTVEPTLRSYSVTHPSGQVVLPQPDGWDQLLFAASGLMTVHTVDARWLVPPNRAVWAPSGVHHRIVTEGRVQIRSLYLAAGVVHEPGPCRAVDVGPFVRELVLHLVERAPLWDDDPADSRLIGVFADQVAGLPDNPLHLPMPTDPRARDVAITLIDDCADDRTVDELARAVSTSRRTLERLFVAETGMSVGRWRTQARVHAAVRLLAGGESVTRVAADVGYSTPSAFGAAFRQVIGTSPGRYLHGGNHRAAR
jgi:AraC-like DNA-binding protein